MDNCYKAFYCCYEKKSVFIVFWQKISTCDKITNMMEINKFQAELNGLPPIKNQYNENEKKLIAEAVDNYGARNVANAYGLKWQTLVAWKKHYANKAKPNIKKWKKSEIRIVIQSPTGQEIIVNELLEKVSEAAKAVGAIGAVGATGTVIDTVYIRADEGRAYWVRENENGAVELW